MNERTPTESELAAAADGSLPAERRERVLASARHSPQLMAALEVQQRAIELTRAVQVNAPARLHERIAQMSARPARSRALAPALALGGALGAAAAAVVIVLGSSGSPTPTFAQISALTLRAATAASPRESRVDNNQLTASVQGVTFPYWGGRVGWRSTGTRVDRVAGRSVTTVFYEDARHLRIGYAIVAGAAPSATGGSVVWRDGVPFRSLSMNGVPTVTWRRAGHLCVISGRGVDSSTLLALASRSYRQASA